MTLFFHGKNLLNLALVHQLQQIGLICRFSPYNHDYQPPPLYIALGHQALNFLGLSKLGTHFDKMHVNASINMCDGFTLTSESLDLRSLGSVVFLPDLYQHLNKICSVEYAQPSLTSIEFCSSSFFRSHQVKETSVGYAIQFILNTEEGDYQAFQLFHWPYILGFLPIGPKKHALIFSSSDKKILLPKDNDAIFSVIQKCFEFSTLKIHSLESTSDLFPLKSYHASHYFNNNKIYFGDAAHSLHPLAGQGMNIGLADAETLVQLLKENKSISAERLGQQFQKKQYLKNALMVQFCQALSMNHARCWAPIAFDMFNRSLLLKRFLFPFYQHLSWSECHSDVRI